MTDNSSNVSHDETKEPSEQFAFTCSRNPMPDNLAIKEDYASAWYTMQNESLHTLGGIPLQQASAENVQSKILKFGTSETRAASIPELTKADLDLVANTSFGIVVCYGQAYRNLQKVWDRFVIQFGLLRVAAGQDVLVVVSSRRFAKRLLETLYVLTKNYEWPSANLGLHEYRGGPDKDYAWWTITPPIAPNPIPVKRSGRFQIVSWKQLAGRGVTADTMILWQPETFYCKQFETDYLEPFVQSKYKEMIILSSERFAIPETSEMLVKSFQDTFGAN